MTGTAPLAANPLSSARWITILPIVFIMYTIAYFDRANIGIALPFIRKELGLDPVQAGMVGGVFAWGYAATQIISGWMTLRLGARNVIGAALVLWGFAAIGTGFIHSYESLLVMRVLLGLFEGPVFAATTILLAEWFTKPERGRAFGFWNLSSPVGAFLAGPISGYLLAHYDWRMMMIVEGLPAWLWAVLWWWRIPTSIDTAAWLDPAERTTVKAALAAEQTTLRPETTAPWWTVLAEPAVWLTLAGFSLINLLISGYTLWLPSVLQSLGIASIEIVGWLSGAPFLMGMLGIYVITRHSDRNGQERRWHAAIPTCLTGAILLFAMAMPAELRMLQIGLIILSGFPMKMFLPLIFARLTEILPRATAVPAVVIVSTTSNLIGGMLGPLLIGYLRQATGNYGAAFMALGAGGMLGGLLFSLVRGARKP